MKKDPKELDIKLIIEDEEKILWYGEPKKNTYFVRGDLLHIPIDLVFFVLFIMKVGVFTSVVFSGIAFLYFGYVLIARFFIKKLRKEKTKYIITDKRIIVAKEFMGENTISLDFKDIKSVQISKRKNGEGDIRFNYTMMYLFGVDNTGLEIFFFGYSAKIKYNFYDIDNVEEVARIISEVRSRN